MASDFGGKCPMCGEFHISQTGLDQHIAAHGWLDKWRYFVRENWHLVRLLAWIGGALLALMWTAAMVEVWS